MSLDGSCVHSLILNVESVGGRLCCHCLCHRIECPMCICSTLQSCSPQSHHSGRKPRSYTGIALTLLLYWKKSVTLMWPKSNRLSQLYGSDRGPYMRVACVFTIVSPHASCHRGTNAQLVSLANGGCRMFFASVHSKKVTSTFTTDFTQRHFFFSSPGERPHRALPLSVRS